MSSTALYKAFIEVGASEKAATEAAEDIIQVSQLPQLATKSDLKSEIARVEVKMAEMEARFIKWMVGSLFVFAGIIIAGVGIVIQIMSAPGIVQ